MTSDLRTIMALDGRWSWKCCCCVFMLLFAMHGVYSINFSRPQVLGFRANTLEGVSMENELLVLTALQPTTLSLYGNDFTPTTVLSFTAVNESQGADCTDHRASDVFGNWVLRKEDTIAFVNVTMDESDTYADYLTMCVKDTNSIEASSKSKWFHQGNDLSMRLRVKKKIGRSTILPIPVQIIFLLVLLCFSGLFSGLNLGLMSLDKTELAIVENCGTEAEKSHAKKIIPLRKRGNFLLCTILLGNVMVNNTLTIFMDNLTGSGMAAVIISTLCIVIFGEIIPQAVCSRHGLAVGAHTIWFTKLFMLLTFPLSFPISKILDCVLGEEVGAVYNRDRLRELLKVTEENMDLVKDEVHIIAGALELSKKIVKDIMTKLDDVYMIEFHGMLDFDTVNQIMKTGYTRIPVYEGEKSNIINLLNIKDLAFVDPDDRTPLKTVCKFYNHPVNYVFEDTKLDVMLEEFKKGRSHMAFVQRVNNEGEGDPFYETLGVVTLEDVIEEILQSEIVDETDIITDNRAKRRRITQTKDFSVFNKPDDQNAVHLSPQLTLVTYQYLSTTVPPFKPELISESVLQRMLHQNVIVNHKMADRQSDSNILYQRGKLCDYFVLIVQGRVEVEIGHDHMVFEGGPFIYFGMQALAGIGPSLSHETSQSSLESINEVYNKPVSYIPDYSVKAISDLQYMKIRRAFYLAAYRASLMDRHPRQNWENSEDPFTREWRKATNVPENYPASSTGGSPITRVPSTLVEEGELPPAEDDTLLPQSANSSPASLSSVLKRTSGDDPGKRGGNGSDKTKDAEVTVDIDDIKAEIIKSSCNNIATATADGEGV